MCVASKNQTLFFLKMVSSERVRRWWGNLLFSVFLIMLYFVADRPLMTLQTHPGSAKRRTHGFWDCICISDDEKPIARGTRGDIQRGWRSWRRRQEISEWRCSKKDHDRVMWGTINGFHGLVFYVSLSLFFTKASMQNDPRNRKSKTTVQILKRKD